MKRIVAVFILSLFAYTTNAQCDDISINLTSSNECLPLAVYNLQGVAPAGATVEWSWQTNPGGAQLLFDQNDDFIVAIKMTQAGVYELLMTTTLLSGEECTSVYQQEIFALPSVNVNIQESYSLCDLTTDAELVIVNQEEFVAVDWIIGDEYYSTFDATFTFTETGTYPLNILAEDTHGCIVNVEDEVVIVDGPSYENTTVSLEASIEELNCLVLGSVHQLSTEVQSDFNAQAIYWETTAETTSTSHSFDVTVANVESQTLSYPIQVQFEACTLDYTFEHAYTVEHATSMTTSYTGEPLCEGEQITLVNTSPQLAWNTNFSWTIEGAQIIAETESEVTFTYEADNLYSWELMFNGNCPTSITQDVIVDADIIQPQLSEGINQLSCLNTHTLNLSHATELEADETYDVNWIVTSATGQTQNSTSESPSFELTELGAYDVSLTISNANTTCEATEVYTDFFNLGGLQVETTNESVRACVGANIYTSSFILSDEVGQYTYDWTISQGANVMYNISGYDNPFQIGSPGIYSVSLLVSDTQSDCDIQIELEDYLEVYEYPVYELTTDEPMFCGDMPSAFPTAVDITFDATVPAVGTDLYSWDWSFNGDLISQHDGELLNYEIDSAGAYTLDLEVVNDYTGCSSTDVLEFTAEDLYISYLNSIWGEYCKGTIFSPGDFMTKSYAPSVNFYWELIDENENVAYSSNLENPDFEFNVVGLYDLSLTLSSDLNDCENNMTVMNLIEVVEAPQLTLTTAALDVCELPHQLLAYADVLDPVQVIPPFSWIDYSWELSKNEQVFATGANYEFSYQLTEPGLYKLKTYVTDTNTGCDAVDSIEITVNDVQVVFQEEVAGEQCVGYSFQPQDFITSSVLNNVEYQWQVLDENENVYLTSVNSSPLFLMNEPSTYSLSLQVSSETNICSFDTLIHNFVSIKALDAIISSEYTSCSLPFEAQMLHNSNLDDVTDPSYLWTFYNVDGSVMETSTDENPSYTYETEGSYGLSLTITDAELGCTDTDMLQEAVLIDSVEIVLDTTQLFLSSCVPYEFNAGTIDLTDNTNGTYTYAWSLVDSLGAVYQTSNTSLGYFNITEAGAYDLQLLVTNTDLNCSDEVLLEDFVLVNDLELSIALEESNSCFNETNTVYKTVTLNEVVSSFDFPVNLTNYTWQINPSVGVTTLSSNEDTLNLSIVDAGEYTVTYTAYFDNGTCQYQDQIDIAVGMIAEMTVPNTICVGNEFALNDDSSPVGSPFPTYEWIAEAGLTIADVNAYSTTMSATEAGTYNLQLTAINEMGCTDTISESIEVYEVLADFTVSDSMLLCASSEVTLISLNNNYINSYEWTISELTNETVVQNSSPNYTHTFTDTGNSDVQLIVASIHGCADTLIQNDIIELDEYAVEIIAYEGEACFNTVDNINKSFSQSISSQLGLDYTISSYGWQITPSLGVTTNFESVDSLALNFTNPGEYSLSYTVVFDDGTCLYSDVITVDLGVVTAINAPSLICAGLPFEVGETSSINMGALSTYAWSAPVGLSIDNPVSPTPNISSDSVATYSLSLTVTNDIGCEVTDSVNVEVYDTEADFTLSQANFACAPASVEVSSLNNDYVANYTWNIYQHLLSGEEHTSNYSSLESTYDYLFTNIASSDVELIIETEHGCLDTLLLENEVTVNDVEFEIIELDDNLCFNGSETVVRTFEIDIAQAYSAPISIDSYQWIISPSIGVSASNNTEMGIILEFENPGSYTLSYDAYLDNENCFYEHEITFDIGVEAELSIPELICAGNEFDLSADVSLNIGANSTFEWAGNTALSFTNSNELETAVVASESGIYEVNFTVTNDAGCWLALGEQMEVYQVEAIFSSPDSGEQCKPAIVDFESLSNAYISSYTWNSSQITFEGDTLLHSETTTEPNHTQLFNQVGASDIELIISSEHGCADTTLLNEYIDIIAPLPYFTFEPNFAGCDSFEVSIIDSSNFIDNYWIDEGAGYIADYVIGDTNVVTYHFPYNETNDWSYEYYISLHAEYKFCDASFQDTVRVYPRPVIDITASDLEGCAPFEVEFEDNSLYAFESLSEYYWDFGDNSVSTEADAVHVFEEPGVYEIYHSVTTQNQCFDDSVWTQVIEVFEPPVADFVAYTPDFCYGLGDVQFEDMSTHDSDTLYYGWHQEGTFITYTEENPVMHFDESGTYQIDLSITDSHGCVDDTMQLINVTIYDTLVDIPVLNYVTVTDQGVVVEWQDTLDFNFGNLSLYHETSAGLWSLEYTSDNVLPNQYLHETASALQINDYTLVVQDSCGYYSDSATVHSTILLDVASNDYQRVDLDWTPYIGWDSVATYGIYRSTEGAEYEWIADVHGDSLHYQDSSLCNRIYTYYVQAQHPTEDFLSHSNKRSIEPMFIDYTVPMHLVYTSVNGDNSIMTEWETHYLSDMTYYNVDRWDDYFGWIENFDQTSESPYIDTEAASSHRNYIYKIAYADVCGNEGPYSRIGTNIVLTGVQYHSHYDLFWTPYEEWDGGVDEHVLQYYNADAGTYQNVVSLGGDEYTYTDTELTKPGLDTSYCYRIMAISAEDNSVRSYSNVQCFVPSPKSYFANAFSPNDDGINELFRYEGSFAKELKVEIYNRWGNVVFSSNSIDFAWDGYSDQTGGKCPQGTYVLRYELEGYDGTLIRDELVIFLLR